MKAHFTGHPGRGCISSPLSSPSPWLAADRSRQSFGILASESVSIRARGRLGLDTRNSTYEVVVDEVADLTRLDAKILECLCCVVDDLVMELSLNLVGRRDGPPQQLVQETSDGLENGLGHIDVSALLVNFPVHKLSNLGRRIILRPIELESLRGGGVVVEHELQSLANIDDLNTSWSDAPHD